MEQGIEGRKGIGQFHGTRQQVAIGATVSPAVDQLEREHTGGRGDQQCVVFGDARRCMMMGVGDQQAGDGLGAPRLGVLRVGLAQPGAVGAQVQDDPLGALRLGTPPPASSSR
ncbi:MAG: hypothetical protein WCJ55_18070 [Chloroflexales bacterium]